ncbi:hypothetical protein KY334_05485 [Candidatus Woesearchaeota archaeon]|nr:hypothetical protein [Candidatus Woesearchaeota archaeon]
MKQSFIGFEKRKYKSVKFNHKKQTLCIDDYIKFMYGANLDSPIIGRVTQLYDKGVEVCTAYGRMHAKCENISRVFE